MITLDGTYRGGFYIHGATYRGGYYPRRFGTYLPGAPGPAAPRPSPELLAFSYSFGGINANLLFIMWQPNGRVRFKCEATVGDDVIGDWTPEGTGILTNTITPLVETVEYTLYYQIDPIPDFPGWDEGLWRIIVAPTDPNLPTWTQPDKDNPVDGDWEEAP